MRITTSRYNLSLTTAHQGRRSARGLLYTACGVQSLRHHWHIPRHQPLAALWYFGGLLWRLKEGTGDVKPVEKLIDWSYRP
jgi:hypothetical protein